MKKIFNKIDRNPAEGKKEKLRAALYFMLVFLYLELTLHLVVFASVDWRIFYPILFSFVAGGVLYLICSLLPQKANRWIGMAVVFALTIYFEVQLIYHCIFGSFLPISQMTMGADAVTNFSAQVVHAILHNLWKAALIFVPAPLTIVLILKKKIRLERLKLLQIPLFIMLICALTGITFTTLYLFDTSESSAYSILVNPNTSTEACVKNLGVAVTAVQETRGFLNAKDDEGFELVFEPTKLDQRENGQANVTELDFSKLKTTNQKLKAINDYLATVSPTAKNQYTGIAKGYNLITICAESFSPVVIDEKLTPTLYKLSNNGFVFKNYYTSFANTTTNGEYAFCMGLMPNMSRTKVESSFDDSNGNYLPYCLGNIYREQGSPAKAYHNYFGTFYDRVISHANMGYDFKAIDAGLNMQVQWPSSDLEMMKVSMPEYIDNEKPFHAYYMTFSGHYQYDWENAMSKKNQAAVADLPYSEPVKAYIACNLELEYALSALMDGLEKAGQADRTVIVLTGDHYPYGLTAEQYNELAGKEIEPTFEKFRNSFICYVPGMEPVEVEEYCSTIDILPTLLNLMGIEYDSRLLAGKDVFSDAPHMAILTDRSFITDEFRYDASTGEVYDHSGKEIEAKGLDDYCNYVANLFTLSNGILETDYYSFAFGRSSHHKDDSTYHFEDVKDPFTEASVLYVVNDGLMKADSKTKFGATRTTACQELIEALYIKSGQKKPGVDARAWALSNDIIEVAITWEKPLTYGAAATIIYRYMTKIEDVKPLVYKEFFGLKLKYPKLKWEEVAAVKWCNIKGVIAGPTGEQSVYDNFDELITRAQLAAYLQRLNHA